MNSQYGHFKLNVMHVCISREVANNNTGRWTGNDSNRQTTRRSPESSEAIDTRR